MARQQGVHMSQECRLGDASKVLRTSATFLGCATNPIWLPRTNGQCLHANFSQCLIPFWLRTGVFRLRSSSVSNVPRMFGPGLSLVPLKVTVQVGYITWFFRHVTAPSCYDRIICIWCIALSWNTFVLLFDLCWWLGCHVVLLSHELLLDSHLLLIVLDCTVGLFWPVAQCCQQAAIWWTVLRWAHYIIVRCFHVSDTLLKILRCRCRKQGNWNV